jgi:hypothetical protein
MIQHDNKFKPGNPNWLPGQSGNPRGRPPGSRQKIADRALALVNDLIHTDAATASLNELMATDPGKFWTIVAGLLPKELEAKIRVQVAAPGNFDPEEWAIVRRILEIVRATAPGAPTDDVCDVIESALRGEFARTIEHEPRLIEHAPALVIDQVAEPEPIAATLPSRHIDA